MRFRAVHRCCVLGCGFPLKISLWVSCLHCVGLQPFGEREGLLAAAGSGKSGCSLCFAYDSERGVSPRLEVGGVSLFCARFALSKLRLFSFSTRTLKSSGVPGRRVQAWGFCVSMLPLACSTPAYSRMSGVLGRRAFSWGPRLLLVGVMLCFQQGSLVGKLSPLCWLAALREAGGAFGADVRGSWSSCVFVRSAVVAFRSNASSQQGSGSLWLSCLHRVGFAAVRGAGRAFRSRGLLAKPWRAVLFCLR